MFRSNHWVRAEKSELCLFQRGAGTCLRAELDSLHVSPAGRGGRGANNAHDGIFIDDVLLLRRWNATLVLLLHFRFQEEALGTLFTAIDWYYAYQHCLVHATYLKIERGVSLLVVAR